MVVKIFFVGEAVLWPLVCCAPEHNLVTPLSGIVWIVIVSVNN